MEKMDIYYQQHVALAFFNILKKKGEPGFGVVGVIQYGYNLCIANQEKQCSTYSLLK